MKNKGISQNTRLLAITSFLVDVSSEMVFPLLPAFLTIFLGAPVIIIGVMESLSEFVIAIADIFSGFYSDKVGRRKKLILFGYSISAFFKGLLVLAGTWLQVVVIRICERTGKGLHESPRDALIGLSEDGPSLGKAFGFRKLFDSAGAMFGPLIAAAIVILFFNETYTEFAYRLIFAVAFVPALLAILVLFFIKDKPSIRATPRFALERIVSNTNIRNFIIVAMIFYLGQFSLMFFILRANEFLPLFLVPIAYLAYTAAYTAFSMPAGIIVDRFGAKSALALAMLFFLTALTGFAFFPSIFVIFLMFAILGCYMAISETAPQILLVKSSQHNHYGSTIGTYRGITGMAAVPANLIAGMLWTIGVLSVPSAFIFSIATTCFAFVLLLIFVKKV